jgi:Putative ATP-binding cassette
MQVVANKKRVARPASASRKASTKSLAATSLSAIPAEAVTARRRLLPGPVRAIVQKDFRLLRRDMRNLSGLVTPLIFGIMYTFMFLRPGGSMFPDTPDMPSILVDISHFISTYGHVGMSLFVGWMLMARLSGVAFSAEGRNYWILKSSPVRAGDLLAAKFLVAYLPTLALGLIFLVGVSIMQKVPFPAFLYGLLATTLCQAGMCGILLAFGAMGANFTWTDPRRMNAGSIGCLGQILTALFLPLSFSTFIGPLALAAVFRWPLSVGYLVGGIAGTIIAGLCAFLPPWLVRKRVERLAEN